MTSLDQIDFNSLKSYGGDSKRSFELLCFQIAENEYKDLGEFTAIDGSGGDGGIEFYLKLKNGDVLGWQCKFFSGRGRLSESNRKGQISGSLKQALTKYPNLKKWSLFLKTDLTPDENKWFEDDLPKEIPKNREVELIFLGESKIIKKLSSPESMGLRSFFFGDVEFNQEWFKRRFEENFEKLKDKYDPDLHSINAKTASFIDLALLNDSCVNIANDLESNIQGQLKDFKHLQGEFLKYKSRNQEEKSAINNLKDEVIKIISLFSDLLNHINNVFKHLKRFRSEKLSEHDYSNLDSKYKKLVKPLNKNLNSNLIQAVIETYEGGIEVIEDCFSYFEWISSRNSVLHFTADAGMGKTHLSCDIAYKKIEKGEPVILLTGKRFSDQASIYEGLSSVLDIGMFSSLNEFLGTLNSYASIVRKKIPIIIDGLNETMNGNQFSNIWRSHLEEFEKKLIGFEHLVLITTCRPTYKELIWGKARGRFKSLSGFNNHILSREATEKYFKKYNIQSNFSGEFISQFRVPIFLKIFCEVSNPNWKSGAKREVSIRRINNYKTLEQYIKQVNSKATSESSHLKPYEDFVESSCIILAEHMWNQNIREVDVDTYYKLIDGPDAVDGFSKAVELLNEGLIIKRDARNDLEYVSFTFDLLAGFFIGKHLINRHSNLNYFTSSIFVSKIRSGVDQHPLFDDTLNALYYLLPTHRNHSFHILLEGSCQLKLSNWIFQRIPQSRLFRPITNRARFYKNCFTESVLYSFNIPAKYLKDIDQNLVEKLFLEQSERSKIIYHFLLNAFIEDHPFNSDFLSKLLFNLDMSQRDLFWSEYIRKNTSKLEIIIQEFESECTSYSSDYSKNRLKATFVMWLLTSTDRAIRDYATRALYHYGKYMPNEYLELVIYSLSINDPYVWERTLASLYGATLAMHKSFDAEEYRVHTLPKIGTSLYKLMFDEKAIRPTTHILARDYAKRTIEICLLHHQELLTETQVNRIRPPFTDLNPFHWNEANYDRSKEFSGPIRMDFSNYTIGGIVTNGSSYANPPEKIKVRNQIYWRIKDLGWSEELFEEAERDLGTRSLHLPRYKRAKIERYGKKYSWIAFFENAGYRDDLNLLDNDWDEFRISTADIDPCFPVKPQNKKFITQDFLAGREKNLNDWYRNSGYPNALDQILTIERDGQEWVLLDAFSVQEDKKIEKQVFSFHRGLFIKEKDFSEVIPLLQKQSFQNRWLPEKPDNYYSYIDELYLFEDAAQDNWRELRFEVGRESKTLKPGDEGYLPRTTLKDKDGRFTISFDEHSEIQVIIPHEKTFPVLLPVMKYNWESHHSLLNQAGNTTVVAKELAKELNLSSQPQSFELLDESGKIASLYFEYEEDYNNNHSLVYLRKDLLNLFLTRKKLKFVWAIWGEREVSFESEDRRNDFFRAHPFEKHQVFQKTIKYSGPDSD
jgi:hypothetical protein